MITVLICGLLAALAGAVLLELYQSKCSERDLLPLKQEVEEYFGREVKMSELELEYDRMLMEMEKKEVEKYFGRQVTMTRFEHEYDRMLTDKSKKAVPSKQVDADLGRETTGIGLDHAHQNKA